MATVLVVDDHPDLCELLARLLRLGGHAAACSTDGAEALDLVRREPPGLVVLDVMMPGMSGLDVLAALRADPETAAVPVVMYSAFADPAARRKALALGAADYLVKGWASYDELRAAVDRFAVQP